MIPSYEDFMYPLLKIFKDNKSHKTSEFHEQLADYFELSDEDKNEYLPSGKQLVYKNRIGWARTYLYKAGLIDQIKRGLYKITERGRSVLNDPKVEGIDKEFLMQYESFREFLKPSQKPAKNEKAELDPEEQLNKNYNQIKESTKKDLLKLIMQSSTQFFEELVVELLVSMGYGGSIADAGQAIGSSGDEGIDGVIKEDVLGLDMIYIQAKRWEGVVGRPEIQKFAGSLAGKQANKGVFITTSSYSKEALDYVDKIAMNIILINGDELTEFMYNYNIGVIESDVYVIKKVNEPFFEE